MTINKEKIRAAAMAATPGPWDTDGFSSVGSTVNDQLNGGYFTAICEGRDKIRNAEHIATSNPSTVLSLLDALDKAEKDAERYRWLRWTGDSEIYIHNQPGVDNCAQLGCEYLDAVIDAAIEQAKGAA